MNNNIRNSILISNEDIEHIITIKKGNDYSINGVSYYKCEVNDSANFKNALSEISNYAKNNKLTNLIVVNNKILKHILFLEKMEQSNIRMEVLNNFKSTFDIKLTDFYIDYEVFYFKNHLIVFVAGILKEFADKIIDCFKSYNFHLLSLEVDISSLKRLTRKFYFNDIVMQVHMRKEKTNFLVLEGNTMFSFRELNYGYNNILDYFSNSNSDSFNRSEFEQCLSKLTIELQRTVDFYNNQFKYKPINRLILTGELVKIPEVDKFLEEFFLIKTEKFFPLKHFYINFKGDVLNRIEYMEELLGTAIREI